MDMTLRDLFPRLSGNIPRLILCSSRKKIENETTRSAVLQGVKIFQDESRLTIIFLGSPGQFSSFHLPAPVYFLLGRPSRILINRSTARFRFFVKFRGHPEKWSFTYPRNPLEIGDPPLRVNDALNPLIIYSYRGRRWFFSMGIGRRKDIYIPMSNRNLSGLTLFDIKHILAYKIYIIQILIYWKRKYINSCDHV